MQKIFFIATILFFSFSCKSSTANNYDLFILFNKPLGNFHIDNEIKKDSVLLGNIITAENTDSSTLVKISLKAKLPTDSKIELRVVDLLDNARIIINQSNSKTYYKNGDTLTGNTSIPPIHLDTSSITVDSMLEKVNPDVRKVLQLDSVKR